VELHFRKVWRVLRRGGTYVLDTPNRVTGPHDISRYFDPVATGFHLKEWTFADLTAQATQLGFVEVRTDLPVWGGLARRLGRSNAMLSCPAAVKAALERPVGALRSRNTRAESPAGSA
jgi:hypothetical protein